MEHGDSRRGVFKPADPFIYVVDSDADVEALIEKLGRMPTVRGVSVTFGSHRTEHAPRLLAAILSMPKIEKVYITSLHLLDYTDASGYMDSLRAAPGRTVRLNFCYCRFSATSIALLFHAVVKSAGITWLKFMQCECTEGSIHALPDIPRGAFRGVIIEHGDVCLIRSVLRACTSTAVESISVQTSHPISRWLGGLQFKELESLQLANSNAAEGAVFDDGPELAHIVHTSSRLKILKLELDFNNSSGISDATVDAIARRQFSALKFMGCTISPRALHTMLENQRNLGELDLVNISCAGRAAKLLANVVDHNPRLTALHIQDTGVVVTEDMAEINKAVRRSTSVVYYYACIQPPLGEVYRSWSDVNWGTQGHQHRNRLRARIDGRVDVHNQVLPVLVSGPCSNMALRYIPGAYPLISDFVTKVMRLAVECESVNISDRKRKREIQGGDEESSYDTDSAQRTGADSWWLARPRPAAPYEELVNMIDHMDRYTPVADDPSLSVRRMIVGYPVCGKVAGFVDAVHVATIAAGGVDAFLATDHPEIDDQRPLVIAYQTAPTEDERIRLDARYPRAEKIPVRELGNHMQKARLAESMNLSECLFTLELLRSQAMYLPPEYVALVAANYDPGTRIMGVACVLRLNNGGVITRLPELLTDLRCMFSSPVMLAKALPPRRRRDGWFEDGWMTHADAAAVFHYAVDGGSAGQVPDDEAVDIMIRFCVVFRVDDRRVVFPVNRYTPMALCAAQARLLAHGRAARVRVQKDGTTVSFEVESDSQITMMLVELQDGAAKVTSLNPRGTTEDLAETFTRYLQ